MASIRSFDGAVPAGHVATAAALRLVSGIGRPDFIDNVLAFCAESFDASFVSIFAPAADSNRRPPLLLGTATTTHPLNAAHAADGYRRHYGEDVNFRILTQAGRDSLYLTYQQAGEIAALGYRRDCYDRTGIADRLSLVRRAPGGRLALSLYRSRTAGPFAEAQRAAVAGAFPLLLEAVDRHLASLPQPAAGVQPAVQAARLRHRFPDLTRRECEVAARVLAGLSAAQIATELGIAESTVVTHRKRAYARIGVDGMKALFRA